MAKFPPGSQCGLCGSADRLHRHHIDWNHDNNASGNVIVVCQRCHVWLHKVGYLDAQELIDVREKVGARDPFRFNGQGSLF